VLCVVFGVLVCSCVSFIIICLLKEIETVCGALGGWLVLRCFLG
jgi:hypothetical protein